MICENVPLKKYNTFGLNYNASCMITVDKEDDVIPLFNGTVKWKKPLLILGSGSNILFTHDFEGTIIYPEFGGIKIEEEDNDKGSVIVSAGAGIIWDEFVGWAVSKGFGGIENLSLIPGKVGATPVQNIGAYGVEVSESIEKVRAISTSDGSVRIFSNTECEFGYRNSIFKNALKNKYLVTRVYFRLMKSPSVNLSYASLKDEVVKLGEKSVLNTRQAVINIRQSKLPDPELIGNAGSFFKNPVVSGSFAGELKAEFPDLPIYDDQDGYKKLAAGWLIDKCGWKGKRNGDAGVHDKQALVLVNHGQATGNEIFELAQEIKKSVSEKFGVILEREVEVI